MYPSKGIPLGLLDIVMVDWIINICPSIDEVSSIFAKSKQLYLCPFAFSRCRWMSANQYVHTSRSAYIFLPGCVAEVWIPLTCNEKKYETRSQTFATLACRKASLYHSKYKSKLPRRGKKQNHDNESSPRYHQEQHQQYQHQPPQP